MGLFFSIARRVKTPESPLPEITSTRGELLISIAREAIARELLGTAAPREPDGLGALGACFVTLRKGGELRGCVGSLEPHRPLWEDLCSNALAAAFRDPRFPPLAAEELDDLQIEVSELEPLEPLSCTSETEALSLLEPGRDGVVLEYERHRATFLPQVWEQLPRPADFLRHLRRKAGLAEDFWHPELRLFRYGVRKWA